VANADIIEQYQFMVCTYLICRMLQVMRHQLKAFHSAFENLSYVNLSSNKLGNVHSVTIPTRSQGFDL
jgi:hypothetical protein